MAQTSRPQARRSTRAPARSWRFVLAAIALLAGACGSDGGGTESSSSSSISVAGDDATSTTEPVETTTTTEGGGPRTTDVDATTTTTADENSTTTSVAPTTAAPTTAAPTTAAPTTAPPTTRRATTTTAPPPPPPTTTTTAPPPPPPTTTTTAPPSSGPKHGTRNTGCEQYMFNQINQARANNGVGPVQFDTGIQYIAIDWSDEMARSQTLKHNPNYANQIAQVRNYQYAAENVGRGYSNEVLFQAFMDSPGHRKNIVNPNYDHVTVGCLNDVNGQLWVTQNFWGP